MLVPIRRIVTHNDADGQSYALIDGVATNVIGVLTELWTTGPTPHDHRHSSRPIGLVAAGAAAGNDHQLRLCLAPRPVH